MKRFFVFVLMIVAASGVWALDNSRDILRDQEIVIGDVIDTGVISEGHHVMIDTTVDQVINLTD
jgi:hypothetical protein